MSTTIWEFIYDLILACRGRLSPLTPSSENPKPFITSPSFAKYISCSTWSKLSNLRRTHGLSEIVSTKTDDSLTHINWHQLELVFSTLSPGRLIKYMSFKSNFKDEPNAWFFCLKHMLKRKKLRNYPTNALCMSVIHMFIYIFGCG